MKLEEKEVQNHEPLSLLPLIAKVLGKSIQEQI